MFYDYHRGEPIRLAKARIQKSELSSVLSLMDLPSNFLPENEHRVTSYRVLEGGREEC